MRVRARRSTSTVLQELKQELHCNGWSLGGRANAGHHAVGHGWVSWSQQTPSAPCGRGRKGTQGKWKRDGNGAPRCDLEIFKLKVLHDVLLNGVLGLEAKPLHVALRVVTRQSSAARGAGQRVNPLV
jgi:hypothetical protein